jgi:hypothetical protein
MNARSPDSRFFAAAASANVAFQSSLSIRARIHLLMAQRLDAQIAPVHRSVIPAYPHALVTGVGNRSRCDEVLATILFTRRGSTMHSKDGV